MSDEKPEGNKTTVPAGSSPRNLSTKFPYSVPYKKYIGTYGSIKWSYAYIYWARYSATNDTYDCDLYLYDEYKNEIFHEKWRDKHQENIELSYDFTYELIIADTAKSFILRDLPNAKSSITGIVYNDNGTLKIS